MVEIAIHLGAHLTDEDRLVRCLMKNRNALARHGIVVPGTGRYRGPLKRIAHEMRAMPTNAETQEALLDTLITEDQPRRIVFSSEGFLANHRWALGQGRLYPAAAEKVANLRRLFPTAQVEFFLALRSPATFLPAMAADARTGGADQVLAGLDPLALRWSDLLARMQEAAPDARITVWRFEDAELLWPELLRELADHPENMVLQGLAEGYEEAVNAEGQRLIAHWLEERPPLSDPLRRRALAAFARTFSSDRPVPPLPDGWDETLCDALEALYEADLDLIAQWPGIEFLEP